VPSALVGARFYGVYGVAAAQFATAVAVLLLNYAVLMRTIQLPFLAIFHRNWRIAAASGVMGTAVAAAAQWTSVGMQVPVGIRLLALVLLGACVYVGVLAAFWVTAGRPAGPELEIVGYARSFIARLRSTPAPSHD
jgi:hypothetical protein